MEGGQWLSPLFYLHPPPSPSRKAEGSLHSMGQEHKGGLCWQSPGWGPECVGLGPGTHSRAPCLGAVRASFRVLEV